MGCLSIKKKDANKTASASVKELIIIISILAAEMYLIVSDGIRYSFFFSLYIACDFVDLNF